MKIFTGQHWHFLVLMVLLMGMYFYTQFDPSILGGEYLGVDTSTWFIIAILSPILHQIYVLVCWRIELINQSISKTLGDKGFRFYKIGFAILILSRVITIFILAASNAHTLPIKPAFAYIFAVLFLIPTVYLFYSVINYFGLDRAFGIDHFHPEKFKNVAFVKKGIFKYTSNGMYIYGFLILWIPGLLYLSKAAILVAFFNHIFIWAHYYFTELPDIKFIYKE